jgi:hypothetical protein
VAAVADLVRKIAGERPIDVGTAVDETDGERGEFARQDADYGVRLSVEVDLAAHDGSVLAEAAFPEAVTKHRDVSAVFQLLARQEGAAKQGLCLQDAEETVGDTRAPQLLHARRSGKHGHPGTGIGSDIVEHLILAEPFFDVREADLVALDAALPLFTPE